MRKTTYKYLEFLVGTKVLILLAWTVTNLLYSYQYRLWFYYFSEIKKECMLKYIHYMKVGSLMVAE